MLHKQTMEINIEESKSYDLFNVLAEADCWCWLYIQKKRTVYHSFCDPFDKERFVSLHIVEVRGSTLLFDLIKESLRAMAISCISTYCDCEWVSMRCAFPASEIEDTNRRSYEIVIHAIDQHIYNSRISRQQITLNCPSISNWIYLSQCLIVYIRTKQISYSWGNIVSQFKYLTCIHLYLLPFEMIQFHALHFTVL